MENITFTDQYSVLDLQHALMNNELVLHYQPQISSNTGEITGLEALIRWEHPTAGLIPPAFFIPVIETSNLIIDVGYWVLKTACEQAKIWQEKFEKNIKIAVNISVKQLLHPDFTTMVKDVLKHTNLEPRLLDLEITEGVTTNIYNIIDPVEQIKKLGVSISIDDFGKGFSSFYYLKELPVDQVKLDRSFVQGINNEKDKVITGAMIDIAQRLKLDIVAEGIETYEQMSIFRDRCNYLQGFYIAKPLPIIDLEVLLRKQVLVRVL